MAELMAVIIPITAMIPKAIIMSVSKLRTQLARNAENACRMVSVPIVIESTQVVRAVHLLSINACTLSMSACHIY